MKENDTAQTPVSASVYFKKICQISKKCMDDFFWKLMLYVF